MWSGRSSTRVRWRTGADIAVVLVLLVSGGPLVAFGAPARTDGRSGAVAPSAQSSPSLVVNASASSVAPGSSALVSAAWEGIPIGCAGAPLWYRWSLPVGTDEGVLSPSDAPNVSFAATTALGGPVMVEVSAGLDLVCNTSARIATANASAGLFVDAPPVLEGLMVEPNPIVPGGEVNLSATIANGEPPFRIEIAWGDGTSSQLEIAQAGAIAVAHRYGAGEFTPSAQLTDSAGATVAATAPEAVASSPGAALAIDAPVAEAGQSVTFEGILDRPPGDFTSEAFCDGQPTVGQWSPIGDDDSDRFSCVFAGAGVDDVALTVFPLDGDGTPVGAQLAEPVVPPFDLNLSAPIGTAEVGQPKSATLWISGGAPPVDVNWALGSTAAGNEIVLPTDGSVELPIVPTAPGNISVVVRTSDPATGGDSVASLEVNVTGTLAGRLSTVNSLTPEGEFDSIFGNISEGDAPFTWWAVPATGGVGPPGASGWLSSDGPFSWQGLYALEGSSVVYLDIADGDGAVWFEAVTVPLAPALEATVATAGIANATGRFLELSVAIDGGVPPFEVEVNASNNGTWNRTAVADGLDVWSLECNDSGSVGLGISVEDQLGVTLVYERTVDLPGPDNSTAPPSSPSGGSPPSTSPSPPAVRSLSAGAGFVVAAVVAALLAAALWAWWVRRRRRVAEESPPHRADPTAIIRGIVEPAEGAERATVELLAEEAGVPAEEVHATIDRLIAEGTLRAETDAEGGEILAWSDAE